MEIKLTRLSSNLAELEALRIKWIRLESNSESMTFFTSWTWVGTWLAMIQSNAWILDVELNHKTVALGIFVERQTGFFSMKKKQLWLNKTGVPDLDQIWIEYNDLLVHREYSDAVSRLVWDNLFSLKTPSFQEIHVDITKRSPPTDHYPKYKMRTEGFLKLLPEDSTAILANFNRNTRQQINRSKRLLELQGEVRLEASIDSASRLDMLAQISVKHKEQWRSSEWGSGFDNPNFCHFHEKLVENNNTVLLKLSVGENAIAFGYYFCFKDTVYFYLSAVERDEDNRVKVGMVFHVLAMEYFQKLGFKKYDFLGGDARYKGSLSDSRYPLYSWSVSRNNWLTKAENLIRNVKQYLGK